MLLIDIVKIDLLGLVPNIQSSLLNIYFRLSEFQSSLLLIYVGNGGAEQVFPLHQSMVQNRCDAPLLRSAQSLRHIICAATTVQLLITETFWWGPLLACMHGQIIFKLS